MKNSKIYIKTAIVYIRVYGKESRNVYSLVEQEKAIIDFTSENGYRILEVFREKNASGKTFDRPAFKEMMHYINTNKWKVKFIIVSDLWRLSTDRDGLEELRWYLKKNGIKLVSLIQLMLKYTGKQPKRPR